MPCHPEIGRFINADIHVATRQGLIGNNVFAYCGNNPVKDFHTYYVSCNAILVHNACNRGVGGKGWHGDSTWRENVKTVGEGGDVYELNGGVPTGNQARTLTEQSGGFIGNYHPAHAPGGVSTHLYNHIHYLTATGIRSAIHVISEY